MNRKPLDNQSGRSLFVVQGRPLVSNASESFRESPALDHGVVMSGEETAYGKSVQVASIDSLLNWFINEGEYPSDITFDLIISDECENHFSKHSRFLKYHDAKRMQLGQHRAYVIGLTATPVATGLSDVYKDIVSAPPTEWLIANGFLSPFRYFRATPGKLDKLVLRGGKYTPDSEAEAMSGLSGDLVRDWKKHAEGRPTVGFFPRQAHAREAMEELNAAGIRAEYVDANTPDDERKVIFQLLDSYKIDYVCNVDLVGRGTDIPAISCVQLCVAIGSVKAFIQKIGRGSRFNLEKYPLKRDCLVLDHGPNISRHGFFEDPRHWTLDISKKDPGEVHSRPTIECPDCGAIYRGGRCRQCGYEPTQRERKCQGLKWNDGELVEIKKSDRKPKKEQTSEQIMISALYMCGKSGRTFKQALGIAYSIGNKQTNKFRVPSRFSVAGRTYMPIPRGHADAHRRVSQTYGFTLGDHSSEGNPYQI